MIIENNIKEGIEEARSSNNVFQKGFKFSRKVVSGKVTFSYDIYSDLDIMDINVLKGIEYAKEQLENIILDKKVEEKVMESKKEELEN